MVLLAPMSAEKIISEKHDLNTITVPLISEVKFSGRVDINHLIARARRIKEKENKINLVFFGLISALVLIVGILLSL